MDERCSSYMTHLRTAHKMPDELDAAGNTGSTNNERGESNDGPGVVGVSGDPPQKHPRIENSGFPQSAPTPSQPPST